ncbi:MAG: cell division protein FtsQ/DivIB [Acidiferrobacterales bacterium]
MKRTNRRQARRVGATRAHSSSWLAVRADPSFRAAIVLLWTLLLLVVAALALDALLRADRFPVEHVDFKGPFQHVQRAQLVEAVEAEIDGNFFALDLDAIKTRVETLPWVYRASVRRQWPRDLHIHFTEQELVASWRDNVWLSRTGELVRLRKSVVSSSLPRLRGPEGTHTQVLAQYRDLSSKLNSLGLAVAALEMTSRRSWRVGLDNGLMLVLERGHPTEKVERFVHAYRSSLAAYAKRIKQVDLRYTNGFSVEWINPSEALSRADLTEAY